MEACFQDLVSIKGCANATSDLYLDQLGITLDEVNAIVNKDYASGQALVNDKLTFAVKITSDRVTNHLLDKIRQTSIIESQRIGFYNDNLQAVAGITGTLKGIRTELHNENSFVDLFVSDISLQTDFTGDISVLVYDLIQNKLLDTLTVPSVAGEISTLIVNKIYKSKRKKLNVIFVYNSTGINSYKTIIKNGFCASCTNNYFLHINNYLKAGGIKIDNSLSKIYGNTVSVADTAGMSINYSIQCNTTDWLCTFANLMALPILYKAAYHIAEYAINHSKRSNSSTLIDLDKWRESMAFYDFEHNKSIGNLLKNIKTPSDNACFSCKKSSKHTFAF